MKQYLIKRLTHKTHSQSTLKDIYQIITLMGICIEKKLNVECYYSQSYITIYIYFDCKGEKIKEIRFYEEVR